MKKIDSILLPPNATIKDAMQIIDNGAMRIALVANPERRLIGTVTDGDIRRAILKGLTLEESVMKILFRKPTVCRPEDSREKILQLSVQKSIYQIPVVDSKGRIVGIHIVDELLKKKSYSNKVVLMAGGLGTRLRPLTNAIPKPLLKVGDKPILQTIIENFAAQGFGEFILSVNYKAEMFEEYFGNGENFGVRIRYVHEEQRLGTAGALSLMRGMLDAPFFVMNGDVLTNIDFTRMLDFHHSRSSAATMAVREYDYQIPFGVVRTDTDRILSIEEKPIYSYFVNAGIYLLNPETIDLIPHDSYFDMPDLFSRMIAKKESVHAYKVEDYWLDIGRIEQFQQAQKEYGEVFET